MADSGAEENLLLKSDFFCFKTSYFLTNILNILVELLGP